LAHLLMPLNLPRVIVTVAIVNLLQYKNIGLPSGCLTRGR